MEELAKKLIILNVSEPPIKEEHVAWRVVQNLTPEHGRIEYVLTEIVRCHYRHPDAPDTATVQNIEERSRGRADITDVQAQPWIIHHASQKVIRSTSRST